MSTQPQEQDRRTVVSGPHKMTPSEAFVETLVTNGVTDMFGIMGSAFMDAMDIFAPALRRDHLRDSQAEPPRPRRGRRGEPQRSG